MRSGHVHRYGLLLLTFGYVDWWMGCECDWSMVFQLALNYLALSWFQSRINYMKSRQTTYSWFWHTLNHVKSHMISSLVFSLFIRVFIGHKIGVCAPIWFNLLIFGYVDGWMGCEYDWSIVFQLALNYLALSWFQSRINYVNSLMIGIILLSLWKHVFDR